ncbi:MAG: hypothetical protein MGG11_12995, partial [Trichodesmium sp. MAG_R03]|nr:hypothetical protein [Trichodesmium sp. MAG_R03]
MMKPLKYLEDSIIYNERSLKRLIRSITISQGQFSLILACCNYQYLQHTIMREVRKLLSVELQEIVLSKTVNTLYTTIDQQLEKFSKSSVVMILDLEKVEAIDELLISTNQVRDEFRKKFMFPLVLWITDSLLAKLIRLAPDFKSWAAATIKFDLATSDLIHLLKLEIDSYWINDSVNKQEELTKLSSSRTKSDFLIPSFLDQFNCYSSKNLSQNKYQEIELAFKDLKKRNDNLEPTLKAKIEFIIGRDDYYNKKIDSALKHYQESLNLWEYEVREQCYKYSPEYPKLSIISERFILEQKGIVLYNIALCYYLQSTQNILDNYQELEQVKLKLKESKQLFEKVSNFVLVAEVITALGQVIKQMEAWGELEAIALEGLKLHHKYGNDLQIAQDYGFLAEVALQKSDWIQAQKLSEKALNILFYAKNITLPTEKNRYLLLLAKSLKNLYRQAEAIEYLEIAEVTEQEAIQDSLKTEENRDPKLYIELLTDLRSLYYEQGKYLQAFRLKKTQRKIEHEYGLLAFIGASRLQPQKQSYTKESLDYQNALPSEITASGRQKDINNLLERISRDDYKLTIIHGRSGVGKSSLVNAGLVPTLNNISISARDTIPVVVQVYKNWLGTLANSLDQALEKKDQLRKNNNNLIKLKTNPTKNKESIFSITSQKSNSEVDKIKPYLYYIKDQFKLIESSVLAQLKNNSENNLLTIIVFDQFEEFFFIRNTSEDREAFYRFLCNCLNIPFVKVILSMREDYLHYLLEWDFLRNLDVINNNILDKKIRYHLRDFSREDAYTVIECLTKRAKFNLEPQLIDAIVDGLADEKQQIRPIELQVVGSQLQEEKNQIQTLEQFQQRFDINPQQAKAKLIKKFLEQVILDCGKENEEATMQVLFALTNDNLTRASRTEKELLEIVQRCIEPIFLVKCESSNLVKNQINYTKETKQLLDLILEILVDSGLLFVRQEYHEKHYQLVHDYVVKPIRKRFSLEKRLQHAEVEIKQAEIAKNQAETDRITTQAKLQAKLNIFLKRQLTVAIAGIILMSLSTIAALGFWQKAILQKQVATAQKYRADINSMTAFSEALFFSGYKFDALIESIRAGQEWQKIKQLLGKNNLSNDAEYRIAASLQQAVYGVNEYNHLEGHSNVVWSVIFHPEGNLIASASADKTIRLWSRDGRLQKTLTDHADKVSKISFSSDGKYLASASHDRTVKIWDLQKLERQPLSLKSHRDLVITLNFSPNNKILVSSSLDKTIKIWNNAGILLKTIRTKTVAKELSFSPNGKIIAAANANGTVQLWNLNGRLLKTLKHGYGNNNDPVYSVNFSPDGSRLVTASGDKTIKIWRFLRKIPILEKTIKGHKKQVISASFSPDSKTIASSSRDKTIKIWQLDGTLLKTFSGHGDIVTQVSFSPDGETLASASYDKTIKLWSLKNDSLNILQGHKHRVLGVSFSPDGQILASASQDNTIKLWSRTGQLLNTLRGHTDRVASVSFNSDGKILASGGYDNTVKLWYFNSLQKIWNWKFLEEPKHWQFDGKNHQFLTIRNEKTIKNQQTKLYLMEKGKFPEDFLATKLNCFVKVGNFCLVPLRKIVSFFPRNFSLLPHQFLKEPKNYSLLDIVVDSRVQVQSRLGQCLPRDIDTVGVNWNWNTDYYPVDFTYTNINLIGHTDSLLSVSFSPNNQVIASSSKDKTVRLWNLEGKLLKTLVGHDEWVSSVSFSPDGKILASASDDGTVKLWTQQGVLLRTIKAHNSWVLGVSFSPDGQMIATASYDNMVKLWNINGELLRTFLKGASDSVTSVSFSPDGQVIASSSYDGKVKLWSLYDGSLLKTLNGHQDSVMSVSFSPDGKLLASGSRD